MSEVRLSRALCAVVGETVTGSHPTLNALYISSGAPGDPPDLAHHSKWKEWLFRAGQNPDVDSLNVLGNILEEFMDTPPVEADDIELWKERRKRVEDALAVDGLEYYQGGRVLPNGTEVPSTVLTAAAKTQSLAPKSVDALLTTIVRGLPRAMLPLSQRRKNAIQLSFKNEYDVQDLLHALLRPWVSDIRAEEFTPSYAGSSTRMDFLLPAHATVIETKIVRSSSHSRKIGEELIIDIAHYRAHPKCESLWCVIYDPERLIENVGGLISDLEGTHSGSQETVTVKVIVI